jgi:dipeptidyl-peptidase-3
MDKKRVNLAAGQDIITTSANNFYESITQSEVEEYYGKLNEKKDPQPVSHGLNSKIMKENGNIIEKVYKIGGMYSEAIQQIVFWLKKAEEIAENELQASCFEKLISFYTSGNLKTFDEYNILWVKDTESLIDTINGFIEVYGDPLGYKATFESVVSIKDIETTEKFQTISNSAGWFELNLPIDNAFKREKPEGVSYKVIQAVAESGDCSPSTPIGINLPNADWIRSQYGSKSVSLVNIEDAYNEVSKDDGTLEEFYLPDQHELIRTYGSLTDKLHTGLHEVIGHGSGKILQGIGSPKETLKNYASTLEEARADLVALYFLYDPYLVSLGLIPSLDAGKAEYIRYIHNGLFKQLVRIEEGAQLEESHMRNRQLIALWSFEKGAEENIIEQISENGKTYFVIHDYEKLRNLFGKLLAEVQRIKSEGDFEAGKKLVENYGVKVDSKLHKEALERYRKLGIAPFSGFVNPKIVPIYKDEEIIDVQIEYPDSFMEQMFDYADNYSVLPN